MVLAKKVIPDRVGNDFSNTSLAVFSKDSILGGAQQVTLTGCLGQLLQLAAYSNEVFSGLLQETTNTHSRITDISKRLDNITARLPQVDDYFMNTNYEELHTKARVEYHGHSHESSQLLNPNTKPPSLNEAYLRANPPPKFELLDPYNDSPDVPCLKLYSNRDFFVGEWVAEMEKQRSQAKEKRKEKRRAREEARAKAGLTKTDNAEVKVEAKPVARARYDPHTGQRIFSADSSSPRLDYVSPRLEKGDSTLPQSTSNPNLRAQPERPQPQPKAATLRATSSTSFTPATPSGLTNPAQPSAQSAAPPYVTLRSNNVVHARQPSAGAETLPPPVAAAAVTPRAVPSLAVPQAPAPQVSPRPAVGKPAPAAPKPPPIKAAPAPPPPPAPSPPTTPTASGSGLAAALAAKGQTLKAAPEAKAKPANSQSDLLQQIRSGISLNTREKKDTEENKKEVAVDNSVGAILARRIALADSDSDEGESEEEWSD